MTWSVRDDDDRRIANLRAALASISARAERGVEENDRAARLGRVALQQIHDACEAALKADELDGGKR